MKKKITRRTFIHQGTRAGAVSILGHTLLQDLYGEEGKERVPERPIDIAVVKGDDIAGMTVKAVDLLGGMKQFVPAEASVCILPNAQSHNPGTHTHPDMVRAVIKMCRQAGAKAVNCLSWLPRKNWDLTGLAQAVEEEGASLKLVDRKDEALFRGVKLPDAKILKEGRVMDMFYDHDVLINLPITKDHAGNKFTGSLKNLMGLTSPKTNLRFHTGHFKNDDIDHLDQCIADLNTIIRPNLCIVDATKFIVTNGPFGPGELQAPGKIVAGTDPVSVDAYCCALRGMEPGDIIMIKRAGEHGLGEMDLTKKHIKEIDLSA
jgi:uncharacterized protein (DUF362 family)